MLTPNRREDHRETWAGKKKVIQSLTLKVHAYTFGHTQFIENKDLPQALYEKARRAAIDHRVSVPETLSDAFQSHGVSGIFIDPESIIISSSKHLRISPRRGTALHHTHLRDDVFETIATSLAEGVGVSTTARIQGVDKKTVLLVLNRAAAHAAKINHRLLRNLVVSECQLDEMWSFIGKKEKNLDFIEKLGGVLGDAWIWIAFDAVNKVFLATVVGKRTEAYAVALLEKVKRVTSRMPSLFSSDQLNQYTNALLQVYGKKAHPARKPGPGRPPKPRLAPPEELLYVQVVKQYKKYRVVKISRNVVFGDPKKVDEILSSSLVSRNINTSYVERGNGTIRHVNSRCNRKTFRFSKCKENHVRQLTLSLAYYHLCRPHKTLTKRNAGQPTTPFMAAGLTDHVWTMGELLRYKPKN